MFGSGVRLAIGYSLAFVLALSLGVSSASADIITFDSNPQFLGPGDFIGAGPNQVINILATTSGDVSFTGGLILTGASSAGANQSSIYGTASFADFPSPLGVITIAFTLPINNFFVNLYNGSPGEDTFTISDNAGQFTIVILGPAGGGASTALVSFLAVGDVVTISSSSSEFWDFFIDDVGFNADTPGTPPTTVPEPGTITLLASAGLIGFVAQLRRRRQLAIQSSR